MINNFAPDGPRRPSAGHQSSKHQATPATDLCPMLHGWSSEQVQAWQQHSAQQRQLSAEFRDYLKDGSAGPMLCLIPPGRFLMGSPQDEAQRESDERQHEVTLEQPFALAKYACTFEEYDRFCNATGRDKPADEDWGRGCRPVINVTWHDALAYAEWLSAQTDQSYRLPSEAEWECACRAGTTKPFYFGETINTKQANYDGSGTKGEYRKKTLPVGHFPANRWGLHEMHGNVWEWTGSEYDDSYQGPEQRLLSQSAPDELRRVVRGGSWDDVPRGLRSAFRDGTTADYRGDYLGFRLARSL